MTEAGPARAAARGLWPAALPAPGLAVLGVAGAAVVFVLAVSPRLVPDLTPSPAGRVLVLVAAVALVVAVVFETGRPRPADTLAAGLGGVGALGTLVVMPDPYSAAVLVVLLGGLHAAWPGVRPLALRMRGPAMAGALIAGGWLLVEAGGEVTGRAGVLALALGAAAAGAVLPYAQEVVAEEPAAASSFVWLGFLGPAIAVTLPARALPALHGQERLVFGLSLLGLGLVNLAWGLVGAWRSESLVEAWRCSYLADWGVGLAGLGIAIAGGLAAAGRGAFLMFVVVVLVRTPLYLWARPVVRGTFPPRTGALAVACGLALAGAVPFAGFAARLAVLTAATQWFWPLAAGLLLGMAAYFGHSFRLGASLGPRRARLAGGVAVVLGLAVAIGVAPGPLLAAAGL